MTEFDDRASPTSHSSGSNQDGLATLEASPGVARIEATAEHLTNSNRVWIFFGLFLIAWAYGLDSTLRVAYQPIAQDALDAHSLLATVTVVRAVIGAAAQPTAAKVADVFGRIEVLLFAVIFYVVGTAIEASATSPAAFAVGSVFYQIGYTTTVLIVEVIVADTTSLRARLFFSYIPAAPFLINTWIGGQVLQTIRKSTSWRYGFWVWCIAYPICALPLIGSLWWVSHKAKRAGSLQVCKTPFQEHGGRHMAKALYWQLDVVGIVLTICVFGCILVPLTIVRGFGATWGSAKVLAPLVIGVLLIPIWVKWETRAPHPMVPFYLLKDRAVWGALAIAFFLMFSWACQGDFLFSMLRVAFNQSEKSANRICALYSFCSTIAGIFVGMVVYRLRRLKPFILFGTLLFLVALGMMIHYRGGSGTHSGIIGAQILLGIAGGFFPYAAQASIQAATSHEHVAVVTGIYMATYNIGSALGSAVSGIVMSQVLSVQLHKRLDEELADAWFSSPLYLLPYFPPGTAERDAVIEAYKHFQRVLCIIGAGGCLGLVVFAFCIRNPKLPDTQSLPYDELPQNEADTHRKLAVSEFSGSQKSCPNCAPIDGRQ